MYAVLGIWSLDEAQRDESEHALHNQVVPLTRQQPGFVRGYWMHDPETGKAHTTIVFDSAEHARAFKALVASRAQQAAQVGVTEDILRIVEVIADADNH